MAIVELGRGPAEIPEQIWAELPLSTRTGLLSMSSRERAEWWARLESELKSCCKDGESE
jgi:hypothetical protein